MSQQGTGVPKGSRSQPRLGLILGPGGIKSFAHIGVLHELDKAQIPVHAIVGLEWGALVAGLYSVKGKANDVEWQMLKLKKNSIPQSKLFRSDADPISINVLDDFFAETVGDALIEKSSISFTCATTFWPTSGLLKQAFKMCMPYPPIYTTSTESIASPFDVRAAASKLREMGADIVVFVNVMAQGQIYRGKDAATQILWKELRNALQRETEGVDFVVGIHTRDYDILNYDARRSLVLFGNQAGVIAVKKLSDKYGL